MRGECVRFTAIPRDRLQIALPRQRPGTAKHHVLEEVSQPTEAGWIVCCADPEVQHLRYYGGAVVRNYENNQPVRQSELERPLRGSSRRGMRHEKAGRNHYRNEKTRACLSPAS